VVALAASTLGGCGSTKAKGEAEKSVATFHQRLDAGNFAAIYASTDPDFRKASTEKDFVGLLDAVHRKLGAVHNSNLAGWRTGTFNFQQRASLNYKTTFANGEAQESFDYRIDGSKASLVGYHINSNALIK